MSSPDVIKLRANLEELGRHRDPTTHVQRVPVADMEFAHVLNGELRRRGRRACVQPWPKEGSVPGKVEQANALATMIAAGQVFVRAEHVAFQRQAAVFSASHLKAGGSCDALDAGMNALLVLGRRCTRDPVGIVVPFRE